MARLIGTLGTPESKYVCGCGSVTKDDIIESIKKGANTLEKVKEDTGANKNGCGCSAKIEEILKEYN